MKPIKLPIRSPNANTKCERVIQTILRECLDHLIVFGKRHLDFLISEFVNYYNKLRAHCGRDYLPPACAEPPPENNDAEPDTIVCLSAGNTSAG